MKQAALSVLALDFHLERYFSVIGKLDCVAKQIDDHLPKPAEIADQRFRHFWSHLTEKFQALFVRAYGNRSECCFQAISYPEIQSFEVNFPCLDLGEVENVVNHGQEGVG